MAPKIREGIGFEVAVCNLEAIAAIDLDAPGPIGLIQKNRIVTDPEELPSEKVIWLKEEGNDVLLDVLDVTFRSVHEYLIRLAGDKGTEEELAVLMRQEIEVSDERILKCLNMLMALCADAARRLGSYLKANVEERPEYVALREFFQRNFASAIIEAEPHNPNEFAIKDMDQVRLDKEYELFYIRNEEGMPYYDLEILRNMRIICDFESEGEFEEDPLLKVRSMLDRDASSSAGQILGDCERTLHEFFKTKSESLLAKKLNNCCMALYLSHNPRNLIQNTNGKTALQYFEDFHRFLRAALHTSEYQKFIAYPPDKSDRNAHAMLNLAHSLCKALFHRAGGIKEEAIGLIHRSKRKGNMPKAKATSLWARFLLEDEAYRSLLSKFPSGPLLKILDLLRSEEAEAQPFDPIAQGNFPMALFHAELDSISFDLLHLPTPTSQEVINKAKVVDEFYGFLRCYHLTGEKHLLFNLQDPTSWKESARCQTLEGVSKNAEFNRVFTMVNLHTPDDSSLSQFVRDQFFNGKKELTHQEQLDFTHIFHLFTVLKTIQQVKPTTVSFTCKDGIDLGAAYAASFYAFLHLLTEDFTDEKTHDYFRWLLYAPALFVRERPIDNEVLNRTLSALETLDRTLLKNGSKEITKFLKIKAIDIKS